VTAVFDLGAGHPALAVLEEAGIDAELELILRRVTSVDGRKTAWINDRRATGEMLRALSDTLVEIHGQQDDSGLLNPRGHRALLDAFAGLDAGPLRAAWDAAGAARAALAASEAALARMKAEEDYLRHAVAELDRLDPRPGEEAALDARRRLMQGAGKIRADIVRAHAALGDEGAERLVIDAHRWLDSVADRTDGLLNAALEALARVLAELGEAQAGVEDAMRRLDFDPDELEAVEERLFAIRALARKHSVLPDDLSSFAEGLRGRLAALDGGERSLAVLARRVRESEAAYDALAAAATAVREEAAGRLDAAMAGELAPLKMERAVFRTEIARGEPGPEGCDRVTFTVATNPGAPAGPLNRIASGGEMSRFLLALKVCLTRGQTGQTLIFDEIDRGVGGATADAVGRRLKALAEGAQVLVVTHSPQVAARGAHHWRVEKRVTGGMTTSVVTALAPLDRVDEIARMLAGDTVTGAAREAARALLAG
jgi:DNA repair protein RecN (Recombination protein N)